MDLHTMICTILSLNQDFGFEKPNLRLFLNKNDQELTDSERKIAHDYIDSIDKKILLNA